MNMNQEAMAIFLRQMADEVENGLFDVLEGTCNYPVVEEKSTSDTKRFERTGEHICEIVLHRTLKYHLTKKAS